MVEQVYNLLKSKGYKFKSYPEIKAAKFTSYKEAFNAAIDIENSFIKVSAGQRDEWLYFGKKIELPEDLDVGKWVEIEEATDENIDEDEERVTFSSVMSSFGLYSSFDVDTKRKFKKRKVVFIGDSDKILNSFYREFNKDLDKVIIIKKKDRVIFKKRQR
jgi:hypothetical protein